MIKYIKKLFAIDAVTKVCATISQFTTIIETLHSAITEIEGDITDNQIDIQTLKTENKRLGNAKAEALGLIRGLNDLLGN